MLVKKKTKKQRRVTKQGFCDILWRKLPSWEVSYKYLFNFTLIVTQVGGVGWGWALNWVWLGGGGGAGGGGHLLGSLSNYDDDHNDDFKKNNRFNDQNNSSARASRFLAHFFDVHCTTTSWSLLIWRFIEDVDIRRRIFLPLFEPE